VDGSSTSDAIAPKALCLDYKDNAFCRNGRTSGAENGVFESFSFFCGFRAVLYAWFQAFSAQNLF